MHHVQPGIYIAFVSTNTTDRLKKKWIIYNCVLSKIDFLIVNAFSSGKASIHNPHNEVTKAATLAANSADSGARDYYSRHFRCKGNSLPVTDWARDLWQWFYIMTFQSAR